MTFNDIISSPTPVLVDFFSHNCGPCRMMSPVVQQLAGELGEKAKVIKVDVDRNPQVLQKYQIMGVPTFMLFQEGEVKWRQAGAMPKQQLKQVVEQFVS